MISLLINFNFNNVHGGVVIAQMIRGVLCVKTMAKFKAARKFFTRPSADIHDRHKAPGHCNHLAEA